MKGGKIMEKRNDLVTSVQTKVKLGKIKITLPPKSRLGYDGCGAHTHKD